MTNGINTTRFFYTYTRVNPGKYNVRQYNTLRTLVTIEWITAKLSVFTDCVDSITYGYFIWLSLRYSLGQYFSSCSPTLPRYLNTLVQYFSVFGLFYSLQSQPLVYSQLIDAKPSNRYYLSQIGFYVLNPVRVLPQVKNAVISPGVYCFAQFLVSIPFNFVVALIYQVKHRSLPNCS